MPQRDEVVDFRCESVAVLPCERMVDLLLILTLCGDGNRRTVRSFRYRRELNVSYGLWIQLIVATHSLNISAQFLHGFGKSVTSVTCPQNRPLTRMGASFHRLQDSVTQRNPGYTTILTHCFYWTCVF